jgi:multiple antibiotic resistance protein
MDFFFATLFSLFSIVDPPGAIPVYVALTSGNTRAERNRIAWQTSLYFLLILVCFFLAGTYILSFFGITLNAMRIAGGMALLLNGFALMSGKFSKKSDYKQEVKNETEDTTDISFSPMAMPMLSGPGSISYLITQNTHYAGWDQRGIIIAAIVSCTGLVYLCLRSAPLLLRVIGAGGLNSIARIMGFLVIAIGVQFFVDGMVHLIQEIK